MAVRTIEDIGLKAMEHSSILMPVLLAFLRDGDSRVAGKSIVCGTNFFCRVLEEITMQVFHLLCLHPSLERHFLSGMVNILNINFAIC